MWLGLCLSVSHSVLQALRRWWSECFAVAWFPARPVAHAHGTPVSAACCRAQKAFIGSSDSCLPLILFHKQARVIAALEFII